MVNRARTWKLWTNEASVIVMKSGQPSEGQNIGVHALNDRDKGREEAQFNVDFEGSEQEIPNLFSPFFSHTHTAVDVALRELDLLFRCNRANVSHIPRQSIREELGRDHVNVQHCGCCGFRKRRRRDSIPEFFRSANGAGDPFLFNVEPRRLRL